MWEISQTEGKATPGTDLHFRTAQTQDCPRMTEGCYSVTVIQCLLISNQSGIVRNIALCENHMSFQMLLKQYHMGNGIKP